MTASGFRQGPLAAGREICSRAATGNNERSLMQFRAPLKCPTTCPVISLYTHSEVVPEPQQASNARMGRPWTVLSRIRAKRHCNDT